MHTNSLFSLAFYDGSKSELIDQLLSYINKNDQPPAVSPGRPLLIFTPNPEQLVAAASTPQFAAALAQADLRLPDGMGVVWASRWLAFWHGGPSLHQRVTGVDVLTAVLALQPPLRVAVIGGQPQPGQAVSQPRSITLPLVGRSAAASQSATWQWLPGYLDVSQPTATEEAAMVRFLQQGRFQVVAVAFGAPWQEYWALRHQAVLAASGVKVVLVVGGAVDILLQRVTRAPRWLQAAGGEWLFRLWQQPWRWRRQLQLLRFIQLTLQETRRADRR